MNFYNENDHKAAAWLRELISAGIIPSGIVDTRSIADLQPADLAGFTQCHFFAGIGVWSYALQLAGWPPDRPVWTGSCPCQPFSVAGKGKGDADERHLWPAFFRLIRECRPERVFGEQVANAIGKGWLDGISADLEGAGYACGAAVLGAHSVGAPHIRRRLYWVADAHGGRREQRHAGEREISEPHTGGNDGRLGIPDRAGREPGRTSTEAAGYRGAVEPAGGTCGMGDTEQPGLEGLTGNGDNGNQPGRLYKGAGGPVAETGAVGAWSDYDIIPCRDGKARRVKPGIQCLAHGITGRVAQLRGLGNAIVPAAGAEFIQAYLESQL